MNTHDDFLFPGVPRDNWQMMPSERIALTGVLARMRPKVSLEVGVYHGGSLALTSQFVEKIYAIDIDPGIIGRFDNPPNAELIVGDSVTEIPRILQMLGEKGTPLEFVLIDADHSTEGVRRDIDLVLQYTPLKPMIIMAHDSGNGLCRQGMRLANWAANPHVRSIDLDFVPGQIIEPSIVNGVGEVWGGFALAYLTPEPRSGPLVMVEGARSSVRALQHAAPNLSLLPAD